MIPVALRLRNFMCYREGLPPLEFGDIHLACLSGPNGAGKSALLDAITWALWGRARGRTDDDLISTGANEMEVEFEFLLEGTPYRVRRQRERAQRGGAGAGKKSGRTRLELEAFGPLGWRSIAGENVPQTERRIVDLLRMDYETFVNSSFLLQGKADLFTLKPPAERKQVLADILGLAYYERLEERARERLRLEERRVQDLAIALEALERQLARQEELERAKEQAAQDVARWQEELDRQWRALEEVRARMSELEAQRLHLTETEKRRTRLKSEVEQLRARCAQQQERVEAARRILEKAPEIEAAYMHFRQLQERNEELSRMAGQRLALAEQVRELEQAIERERSRYVTEREVLRRQIAEREHRLRERPQLLERLNRLAQQLEQAQELEQQRTALQAEERARMETIQTLRAECQRLREEMSLLREKLALLAEGEANCPLCQSPLGAEGLERVRRSYEAEDKEKRDLYRAREAAAQQEEKEIARLRGKLQELEEQLRGRSLLEQERAVLERMLAELEHLAQDQARDQAALASIENTLASGDFAHEARRALTAVRQELETLPYDRAEHDALRKELLRLRGIEAEYRQLTAARMQLEAEERLLGETRTALLEREDELQCVETQLQQLQEVLAEWAALQHRRQQLESAWKSAQLQLQRADQALGAALGELQQLERLDEERKEKERELKKRRDQVAIYQELLESLGKRGVQAMLIESAVPEIEQEANLLLRQMSDGEMSVQVAMQRVTQKGTVQETLDIHVSDLRGTRPYEMFSGGEKLRIDFALRIALSRLLARRAGARLQTLVIDEGFGSQDTQGREKLVEAIHSVEGDFEKILVITHLQELKERFPVRIEIERTEEGSRWTVV